MKKSSTRNFPIMVTAALLILAALSGCTQKRTEALIPEDTQTSCSESSDTITSAESTVADTTEKTQDETTEAPSTVESEKPETTYEAPDVTTEQHSHIYSSVCDATCDECGEKRNVPDHVYDSACDATCNECGEKRSVPDHVYDSVCDATCNECKAKRNVPNHVYDSACDATCNNCEAKRNVPDHVYDSACDATCNECGEKRSVPDHVYNSDSKCEDLTCSECGFVLEQEHDYARIQYTAPSLLATGYEKVRCTLCQKERSQNLDKLTPADLGMPAVYFTEASSASVDLVDLEKADGEIPIFIEYQSNSANIESFAGVAKIKIQGASSTQFAKKNFTIKLYQDQSFAKGTKLKVDLGWGKENQYCLKANYMDFSYARNIVSANIFTQLVRSRKNPNPNLLNAPNCGVIDGYPVLVYLNGEFYGFYTMNIPKDEWMFAMDGDETAREAILMAEDWTAYTALRQKIGVDVFDNYGWELEYSSTGDLDVSWIKDSFNALIEILNCGNKSKIRAELHNHLDIEAAIDNMLFTFFIDGVDLTSKNILWATYDGKVWIPSMYDMDMTYGISWDGSPLSEKQHLRPYMKEDGSISLWDKPSLYNTLLKYYPAEVEARWWELRKEILTLENVKAHFDAFYAKAPKKAYDADREKWLDLKSWPYAFYYKNHTNYYNITKEQIAYLDAFFNDFN